MPSREYPSIFTSSALYASRFSISSSKFQRTWKPRLISPKFEKPNQFFKNLSSPHLSPIRSPSGNPKPLFHHPQSRYQLILLNRSGSPSTITPSHKSGPPLSNTNRTQKKHIATPRRRSTNRDLLPCRLYAADRSHQPVGIAKELLAQRHPGFTQLWGFPGGGGFEPCSDQNGLGGDSGLPGLPDPV